MPVITIARQHGAGGSNVAAMVAERLGADLVDGVDWGDPLSCTLECNTGVLGCVRTGEIILTAADRLARAPASSAARPLEVAR